MGFPDSSVGNESACNAGDCGSIPRSGRSTGEGIGYALQYSWASVVAQLVKNLPAMQETWVRSLGWEDPLEKEIATHSSIVAWKILMDRGSWWATVHGVAKSQTQLSDFHFPFDLYRNLPHVLLSGNSHCGRGFTHPPATSEEDPHRGM